MEAPRAEEDPKSSAKRKPTLKSKPNASAKPKPKLSKRQKGLHKLECYLPIFQLRAAFTEAVRPQRSPYIDLAVFSEAFHKELDRIAEDNPGKPIACELITPSFVSRLSLQPRHATGIWRRY